MKTRLMIGLSLCLAAACAGQVILKDLEVEGDTVRIVLLAAYSNLTAVRFEIELVGGYLDPASGDDYTDSLRRSVMLPPNSSVGFELELRAENGAYRRSWIEVYADGDLLGRWTDDSPREKRTAEAVEEDNAGDGVIDE